MTVDRREFFKRTVGAATVTIVGGITLSKGNVITFPPPPTDNWGTITHALVTSDRLRSKAWIALTGKDDNAVSEKIPIEIDTWVEGEELRLTVTSEVIFEPARYAGYVNVGIFRREDGEPAVFNVNDHPLQPFLLGDMLRIVPC